MDAKTLLGLLPVDWLAATSINMAEKVLDKVIEGERLNETEVKIIQSAYSESEIWLTDVVKNQRNTYALETLEMFRRSCEDAATEGGFPLPTLMFPETP